MAVYFHGNFELNRERMRGLLKSALENPELKDGELAQLFGFKAPYAQRYRQWLYRTGIISLQLPLELTPMGAVIYKHDPKLETLTSQWFMHWELVTDPERAEAWNFFWYDFSQKHERFSREMLQTALMEKLRKHSEEHFGPNSTMLPGITQKLIQCYTSDHALGMLKLVQQEHSGYVFGDRQQVMGPWDRPIDLITAFGS